MKSIKEKHLRLLLALKDHLYQDMKGKLATQKHIDRFVSLQNRIERIRKRHQKNRVNELEQNYQEKVKRIIDDTKFSTNHLHESGTGSLF